MNLLSSKDHATAMHYLTQAVSAERVRQGKVSGVTPRVLRMYMAAARLSCKRAMVGTGWANSHIGCMSRLRKHYSHILGG